MCGKLVLSLVFLILSFVSQVFCGDEVLVQINLRRPINVVSDKYVSFTIDPNILIDSANNSNSYVTDYMAKQLKPAYLRVAGDSFFNLSFALSNKENKKTSKLEIPQEIWKNFYEWIRAIGWKPVIPLPYEPNNWKPRESLQILNVSSALGVKECIWQLGYDFSTTDAHKYASDIRTLKTMVEAFKGDTSSWGIVGADISAGSSLDETRKFIEFAKDSVKAVGWKQRSQNFLLEKQTLGRDLALRTVLSKDIPVWLTLSKEKTVPLNDKKDARKSLESDLRWAQTLGEAAQNGFSVIYKNLDLSDICEPGLAYFITALFKRTMGEKVFDTRIFSGDRYQTHIYSHCTKNQSGSLTIMGVNTNDFEALVVSKWIGRNVDTDILQYILTVDRNGQILLNGEPLHLDSALNPAVITMGYKQQFSEFLPAKSVGFWVLPKFGVNECVGNSVSGESWLSLEDEERGSNRIKTSSDKLLQQLISENLMDGNSLKRNRREVKTDENLNDVEDELRDKRFILKSTFPGKIKKVLKGVKPIDWDLENLPRLKKSLSIYRNGNNFKISSVRFKRQANSPFKRSSLKERMASWKEKLAKVSIREPTRDSSMMADDTPGPDEQQLFASRENPKLPQGDVFMTISKGPSQDYDYVEFDEAPKNKKSSKGKKNYESHNADEHIPTAFKESYKINKVIPQSHANFNTELWEVGSKPGNNKKIINQRLPIDRNVGYVVQELEPTWKQNFERLQKTKQQIKSYYMETPESAENQHEFDYGPKPATFPGFQSMSEDNDGFFDSKRKSRTRRSIQKVEKKTKTSKKAKAKSFNLKKAFKKRIPRNAVAVSWTVERSNNLIPKELDEDTAYEIIVPYMSNKNYQRSVRPENYWVVEAQRATTTTTPPPTTTQSVVDEGNQDSDAGKPPKFMVAFSESVSNLMDMINNHVSGWWNSFA